MTLQARVGLSLGSLLLDAEVMVRDGEMVAVVGPNGAGKTTLLRGLAGLIPLLSGRVTIDDLVLEDPAIGHWLPPERRPVGMVFQDYRLFPRLSAVDNVAFGLRARGVAKADAVRRAHAWLDRVGLAEHGARPPGLSGGQAQRVAVARALITEPRLLLLDEPLAAVDVSARADLRRALKEALGDFTGARLLVTHDPLEAAALADRVVVLEGGQVVQQGTVAEVTARPRSAWVAAMMGLNWYPGRARGTVVRVVGGIDLITAVDAEGEVFAVVHPRAVTLQRGEPHSSARNVWPGTVDSLDLHGDRARVRVSGPLPMVAEVTPGAVADLHLADGGTIWISVKATEVEVYRA